MDCNCNNINNINKFSKNKFEKKCCCLEHLKPLEIDSLFLDDVNQCSVYEDTLN